MPVSDLGVSLGKLVFKGFNHYTTLAMETQEATLQKIMKQNEDCYLGQKYDFKNIHSIRDYQDNVPLSTFDDYVPFVDRMVEKNELNLITSKKIIRYCSSSGSIGKPKIQPKTGRDIWNMQCMGFCAPVACAAMHVEKQGKKFNKQIGPLALSLNGHPLENGMRCNGAGQVPLTYLTPLLKYFCTTPKDFLYPKDEENTDLAYFQALFALKNRDVSYLGSMVITLLNQMFECMEEKWEMLCDDIEKGTINPSVKCPEDIRAKYNKKLKPDPKRANELRAEFKKGFDTPIAQRVWPKVQWGYGMISSTLSVYEKKLRKYIGDLPMHNMGYAASEGYMAMPTDLNSSDYVLLPRSLIYEFLPLDHEEGMRPLTLGEIEVGKDYEIIVTNFSGLYRYRIEDVVHVTGMYNNSPRVEFLYRLNMGINIANEKTTTAMIDWAAEKTAEECEVKLKAHSFYANTDVEPVRYEMLFEAENEVSEETRLKMVSVLDEKLRDCNEKYLKYRRWGMIGDPVVHVLKQGTYDGYIEMLRHQGRIVNQVKPVAVINTPERKEYFFSKIESDTVSAAAEKK